MAAVPARTALPGVMPWMGAIMIAVTAAKPPAMAHTIVEVRLVLIPKTRAVSGFDADARTISPKRVFVMKRARPRIVSGATMRTMTSRETTRIESVICHDRSKGSGKGSEAAASGRSRRATNSSWAKPMVAISRTRRDDAARRRTTVISTTTLMSTLVPTARKKDGQ